MAVERQIPVASLAEHGRGAAHGAARVDEFGGRECRAAFLALVAIGPFGVAVRTFARDVAVGQESLGFLVIVLLTLFFHKLALVVERAEEVGGQLAVGGRGGATKEVERDAKAFKRFADDAVVAVYDFLGRAALFAGTDGDGHAVFV